MKTKSEYLNFEELPNGNLLLTLTEEGKEYLKERLSTVNYDESIWYDLLEQTSCNGSYAMVDASETGDLTDSPIIVSHSDIDDDGNFVWHNDTKKWWFPAYAVINELEGLLEEGQLTFTKA